MSQSPHIGHHLPPKGLVVLEVATFPSLPVPSLPFPPSFMPLFLCVSSIRVFSVLVFVLFLLDILRPCMTYLPWFVLSVFFLFGT